MISFRIMVSGVWLVMLAVCVNRRKTICLPQPGNVNLYLNAAFFFWTVLGLFFLDALLKDTCLVPADIFNNYYPWKIISGNATHNPLLSDITGCVYPWMGTIQKSLKAFELPLWNPYAYSGSPLAANQVSAAFHPFNLLFFLMPLPDAATFFPFLRLFIAAMGMFTLCVSWRLSRQSAILGAIIYGFCGVHVSWLSNYPEVSVTMLIPWIVLSLDQIAINGSGRWWLIFIGLSVVQFLGGHCETSFHVYAWAIPFFFIRLYQQKKKINRQAILSRITLLVAACFFSLGISAFQLLPFLEYLPLSTRMHEIANQGANLFVGLDFISVLTTATATLISPDFYGNPVAGNYWGAFNFIEQNTHLTITGLFFSLMAIIRKSENREIQFLKLVFLGGGLFAYLIAVRTPGLFDFVVSLPLFKQNSNHRLIIIFSFAFSILAAMEAHDVQMSGNRHWGAAIMVTSGILLAALFLHRFDSTLLTTDQLQYRWFHLQLFLIFSGLGCLFYSMGIFVLPIRKYLPALAAGLALLEIFTWGGNFNTFVPRNEIFPSTPLTDFIRSRQGQFRIAALPDIMPSGTEQIFEIHSISGLDPMKTNTYEKVFSQISGEYSSIFTSSITSFSSPWIDFLNVQYLLAPPGTLPRDMGNKELKVVYDGKDGMVYQNPTAFEPVFRVRKVITALNNTQAFQFTKDIENQLDPVAVIEGNVQLPHPSVTPPPPPPPPPSVPNLFKAQ